MTLSLIVWPTHKADAGNFTMQSGYYVGTGASLSITGVGFEPDLVFIKGNQSSGAAVFKSSSMPTQNMAFVTAVLPDETSQLLLNSDGFTVGTNASVNTAGVRYQWIAFGGSDCSATGNFCVGTYNGTGVNPRYVTGVGFQPNLVIVKRLGSTVQAYYRTSSMGAAESTYFYNLRTDGSGNNIRNFDTDGFYVGSVANNAAGIFDFIAFKSTAGSMAVGSFTGDGLDNKNITGVGFQPDFVFIKNNTNTTSNNTYGIFSTQENYGDSGAHWANVANAVNTIQALQSDGFQVGTSVYANGSGNTMVWAAFKGVATSTTSGTYQMTNGTYTGTGSAFSVTGLPFAPHLVIIKDNSTQQSVFKTTTMGGDSTAYLGSATANFAGGITALNSDGFTLGTSLIVNTNGGTYHWQAFGNALNPYTNTGATDFAIGAYYGNGLDSRDITRLPWQPDLVVTKRNGASAGVFRTSETAGDLTSSFSAVAETADYIQALNADGFEVGTNAVVNTSTGLYHWFGFKAGTKLDVGTYTGNATDNRNITGVGFQPDLLWIKRSTAVNGVFKPSSLTGDAAQYFVNTANATDRIQNFINDGFQIGGNQTETNTSAGTYRYVAWDGKKYTQSSYRFFANSNATDVGSAIDAQDTAIDLTSAGQIFRLRMLMRVDQGNLYASGENFKLQYVDKGTGTCSSPSGGTPSTYTDVTTGTLMAYYNNATPADGASLTSNASDPTDGGRTIVNQTYEEANNFTNSQGAILNGQDGKWDFSLYDNGATAGDEYCFRIVKSGGTELDTYSQYPSVTAYDAFSNSLPVASAVSIDSGAAGITLNEGTTKSVSCVGTVTDNDGFADITSVTADFYRTSVGTSSPLDDNDHYRRTGDTECVPSSGSGTSETYTCAFTVQYFADPTDAGSPNSGDTWSCTLTPSDDVGTGTVSSDTIEMNTLVALSVDGTISYGTLNPGQNTDTTNQSLTITNTGNVAMDPQISGADMEFGVNVISPSYQKYLADAFDYDTQGVSLSTTPTTLNLTLPQRTSTAISDTVYFGIGVPNGSPAGVYTGTNTFTAVAE